MARCWRSWICLSACGLTFSAAACDDAGCIRNSQCPDPLVCRAHACVQPADSGPRDAAREQRPDAGGDRQPVDLRREAATDAHREAATDAHREAATDAHREAAAKDRSGDSQ